MQVDGLQQKQTEGVYSFSQGDDMLMSPVSPIHQDASFAASPATIFTSVDWRSHADKTVSAFPGESPVKCRLILCNRSDGRRLIVYSRWWHAYVSSVSHSSRCKYCRPPSSHIQTHTLTRLSTGDLMLTKMSQLFQKNYLLNAGWCFATGATEGFYSFSQGDDTLIVSCVSNSSRCKSPARHAHIHIYMLTGDLMPTNMSQLLKENPLLNAG